MVTFEEIINYFTDPTATGYTVEKTLIFALLLIGAVYGIFELMKKIKLKLDYRLVLGIIPYVLVGGTLRVIEDAGIFTSYWLVTPGIYILTFAIALITLFVSLFLQNKFGIPYFKIFFTVGLLSFAFLLPLLNFVNLHGLLFVALFFVPWIIILYKIRWGLVNKLVALAQMFDATATYVAIEFFGYYEKHVLPSFLINVFSPVSFIFVKIIGIVIILFLIDKSKGDKEFNNFLKLIIGILGLGTGTRDFLRLLALV